MPDPLDEDMGWKNLNELCKFTPTDEEQCHDLSPGGSPSYWSLFFLQVTGLPEHIHSTLVIARDVLF